MRQRFTSIDRPSSCSRRWLRGAEYSSTLAVIRWLGTKSRRKSNQKSDICVRTRPLPGMPWVQDAIERGDTVGGDDEQVVTDAVNVAHFASRNQFHAAWGRLLTCGRLAIGPLLCVRILEAIATI